MSLTAIIISISGCTTVSRQQPVSPPVINNFAASPTNISQGQHTTLSWDVSGAATINIQPDIGTVGQNGSLQLSPNESTAYTLTATNQASSSINSVTVTVEPKVTGKADLVITDIWVEGAICYYKNKNQGNADAKASTSYLYINNLNYKLASDGVKPLAAGEEITASFSNFEWNFVQTSGPVTYFSADVPPRGTLQTYIVKVCADTDNAIDESDEVNNCITRDVFG